MTLQRFSKSLGVFPKDEPKVIRGEKMVSELAVLWAPRVKADKGGLCLCEVLVH